MKRIIAFICSCTMLMMLCGCSQKPQYYNPAPLFFPMDNIISCQYPEGREPSSVLLNECEEIFKNLSKHYNIEKELPSIRVLSLKEMAEATGKPETIEVVGAYKDGTLYIVDDCFVDEGFKATIAHELLHYLSDNGNEAGPGLRYCSQGQLMGATLDEGVTNYLSTLVYPFPDYVCVYEFETHAAEQLALAVGEDKLAEAYFKSDILAIKEAFDNSLKETYKTITVEEYKSTNMEGIVLSPFDIFTGTLNAYNYFLSSISMYTSNLNYAMLQAETAEEMLMFYGSVNGVEEKMKQNLTKFLESENQITWTYYTRLEELT